MIPPGKTPSVRLCATFWKLGPAFDLALEASLREPASGEDTGSGILLKGSKRW